MKSIIKNPFLIVCIVAGIIILLWLNGCFKSKYANPEIKVYQDSISKINKAFDAKDRKFLVDSERLANKVIYYAHRSDSLEQLRNEDLKLLAASKAIGIPLIISVKNDSNSTKQCDSLAGEFANYIWANEIENEVTDSLLASKDFQIAALDSSLENSLMAYEMCKQYFKTSVELFGATYLAYQKAKPRNVISLSAGTQYFTGTKIYAALAGFDFMNKKQQSLTVLFAVDNKQNTGGQLLFKLPIRLHKK